MPIHWSFIKRVAIVQSGNILCLHNSIWILDRRAFALISCGISYLSNCMIRFDCFTLMLLCAVQWQCWPAWLIAWWCHSIACGLCTLVLLYWPLLFVCAQIEDCKSRLFFTVSLLHRLIVAVYRRMYNPYVGCIVIL